MRTEQKYTTDELERFYWSFVFERQAMFERRRQGNPPPWTEDKTLATHRFTNVYRAADRVSQYMLRNVIYSGSKLPNETIFRSILFRIFNQPATWEVWMRGLEEPPTLRNWNVVRYGRMLDKAIADGIQIWNNAYMITPPLDTYGGVKHDGWLRVLDKIVSSGGLWAIHDAATLEEVYRILLTYPTVGPFFAMQWTTDLGYSEALKAPEDTFVRPGGGAIRGLRKFFPGRVGSAEATVRWITNRQEEKLAQFGQFAYLGGKHKLQLMDIQNTLCEVDKWSREALPALALEGRWYQRIKQSFDPNMAEWHKPIAWFFPPKWGIEVSYKTRHVSVSGK